MTNPGVTGHELTVRALEDATLWAKLHLDARHHALTCALTWLDDRGELKESIPEDAIAIAAKFAAFLTTEEE